MGLRPPLLFGSALLLVWLGCNGSPEPAPPQQEQQVQPTGMLTVANTSRDVIFRVRFAPVGQKGWGPDRLDKSEVIKSKERRSWTVPTGSYRVFVELSQNQGLTVPRTYRVGGNQEAVCTISRALKELQRLGTLTLENATGYAIAGVFISPTSQMGWGKDRLGESEVIALKRKRSWTLEPGTYNLKIQFQDQETLVGPGSYQVVAGEERVYRIGTHQ